MFVRFFIIPEKEYFSSYYEKPFRLEGVLIVNLRFKLLIQLIWPKDYGGYSCHPLSVVHPLDQWISKEPLPFNNSLMLANDSGVVGFLPGNCINQETFNRECEDTKRKTCRCYRLFVCGLFGEFDPTFILPLQRGGQSMGREILR